MTATHTEVSSQACDIYRRLVRSSSLLYKICTRIRDLGTCPDKRTHQICHHHSVQMWRIEVIAHCWKAAHVIRLQSRTPH